MVGRGSERGNVALRVRYEGSCLTGSNSFLHTVLFRANFYPSSGAQDWVFFTTYGIVSCCCGRQGFRARQRGTTCTVWRKLLDWFKQLPSYRTVLGKLLPIFRSARLRFFFTTNGIVSCCCGRQGFVARQRGTMCTVWRKLLDWFKQLPSYLTVLGKLLPIFRSARLRFFFTTNGIVSCCCGRQGFEARQRGTTCTIWRKLLEPANDAICNLLQRILTTWRRIRQVGSEQ